MPSRVIYILQDPIRPDLVKVGKDSNWPLRYRQARSQSPREICCAAIWRFIDGPSLGQAEAAARTGLQVYDSGNNNREWFIASAEAAVSHVQAALRRRPNETLSTPGRRSWQDVVPWDAWRDSAKYTTTKARRRLWVGAEISDAGTVGALKVVHSPYFDVFFQFAPTYACFKFRWVGWWQVREPQVTDSGNRAIYDLWHGLVKEHGQGAKDTAVGWLRHRDGRPKIDVKTLRDKLDGLGLVAGNPRAPKPLDAPPYDSSNSGRRIAYDTVPAQGLIFETP